MNKKEEADQQLPNQRNTIYNRNRTRDSQQYPYGFKHCNQKTAQAVYFLDFEMPQPLITKGSLSYATTKRLAPSYQCTCREKKLKRFVLGNKIEGWKHK